MNEVDAPTFNPSGYAVVGNDGNVTLSRVALEGLSSIKVSITAGDQDVMKRWKGGALLNRAEDSTVSYYVGNLHAAMALTPRTAESTGPDVTRVTTADTTRYINVRDALSSTINDYLPTTITDAEAREVAEAIMNDFNIELP